MRALRFIVALAISAAAAAIGSFFTVSAISGWYAALNKSFLNPPNWIFAPVWTVLYLLMAIALFLYWETPNQSDKKTGYLFFGIQLVLNVLWSIIFFGAHQPVLAMIDIAGLWVFIVLTIAAFHRLSKPAAYLLWPYLAWVTFAIALNISVVVLN